MKKAIIVSQFVETRLSLERCLGELAQIASVTSVHQFKECDGPLNGAEQIGYIFIADAFEAHDIAAFIEQAKRSSQAKDACFLLVVGGEAQPNYLVANQMMVGFHAFVFEPVSLAAIEDALRVAEAVRSKQSGARLRAAAGLMLTEVFDEARKNPKNDLVPPEEPDADQNIWSRVQASCETFKEITGESVSTTVVRELKELKPTERLPSYTGVSNRVRNIFEQKLKARLNLLGRTRRVS